MADIAPVPPATPPTSTPTLPAVTPVETTVSSLPDRIQQLTRQIQVTGTIAVPPEGGEIVLNTVLGSLKILLPVLTELHQKNLEKQLIDLFQNQKPLTIVIQPGDPPTQSFLLLPPAPKTPNVPPPAIDPNTVLPTTPPRPVLIPGTVLSAVVLPPASAPRPTTAPAPPPVAGTPVIPVAPDIPFDPAVPAAARPAAAPPVSALGAPAVPFVPPPFEDIPILPAATFLDEVAVKVKTYADQIIPKIQQQILSVLTPQEETTHPVQRVDASTPPTATGTTAPAQASTVPSLPAETSLIDLVLHSRLTAAVKSIFVETQSQPLPQQPLPQAPPAFSSAFQPPIPSSPSFQSHAAVPLQVLFQPGVELSLRVDTVTVPLTSPPLPGLPNQVTATVIGNGPGGQLLLKAGDATLYVRDNAHLPVGTSLLITVEPKETPVLQPLAALPGANDFAAIQQALVALAQIDPALARAVTDNRVPQPTKALSGALLFFLSAVRQGDVGGWLGSDTMDALNRIGRFELISKLAQDMTQSAQTVRDPAGGAWRSYPIPLFVNQQFQILNMYVHGDGGRHGAQGQEAAKRGVSSVRFLIDMRLSKLGPMQLDGLVRPKQLDMIVRSEQPLPAGLDHELRTTYANVTSALGYAGTLNIQTGRQHWLTIYKDTPATGSVMT